MNEFLTIILTLPTVAYGVLLAVCVIYWMLAATGLFDLDTVDGWLGSDGDSIEPSVVAGMLAKIGLSGIPLMLVLTVLALFGWIVCFLAQRYLLPLAPDALRGLVAIVIAVAALVPGVLATSVALRPLAKLIARLRPPVPPSVLGRIGRVISPIVDERNGRAHFDDGGAGLILQVRALPDQNFQRGDQVVLIEHLDATNAFRIISKADFDQQ
ncbi:MAG: YqiJ family protein [Xanthomonadaceae bacterium]|nr:YqiJ family protein [Xanthomonadaceae bacterium]